MKPVHRQAATMAAYRVTVTVALIKLGIQRQFEVPTVPYTVNKPSAGSNSQGCCLGRACGSGRCRRHRGASGRSTSGGHGPARHWRRKLRALPGAYAPDARPVADQADAAHVRPHLSHQCTQGVDFPFTALKLTVLLPRLESGLVQAVLEFRSRERPTRVLTMDSVVHSMKLPLTEPVRVLVDKIARKLGTCSSPTHWEPHRPGLTPAMPHLKRCVPQRCHRVPALASSSRDRARTARTWTSAGTRCRRPCSPWPAWAWWMGSGPATRPRPRRCGILATVRAKPRAKEVALHGAYKLEGCPLALLHADTFLPGDCTLEQLNLAAHEVLLFKRAVHTNDHRVDASDPALLSLIWHQVV